MSNLFHFIHENGVDKINLSIYRLRDFLLADLFYVMNKKRVKKWYNKK